MLDLNHHENAALVDAHAKKCKLRTEAESAHAKAFARKKSFDDLEEIEVPSHPRARGVDDVFMSI